MLFYFGLPAQQLAAANHQTLATVAADILRARREGSHLVIIPRATASWLRDNLQLGERDRAMLERLIQEYAQTAGLRQAAQVYVNVVADPSENFSISENAINVSLTHLAHCNILQRPVLLVENLQSDGRLYEFLLTGHCKKMGCIVAFDVAHGGGADLPMVFEHQIDQQRIVIGITDSDNNAPDHGSSKLQSLTALALGKSWPLAFAASPPCREGENLIPLEVLLSFPCAHRHRTNSMLLRIAAEEIKNRHPTNQQYWLFFDSKEGLSTDRFQRLSPAEQGWITSKTALANFDPSDSDIEGYGNRITNQLFNDNRLQSDFMRISKQPVWQSIFSTFIETLVWPAAASTKVYT